MEQESYMYRWFQDLPNVFGIIKQMHLLSKLLEVVISIFR